jgi:hypothetical protein
MKLSPYNESLKKDIENYHLVDLSFTSLPKKVIETAQENTFGSVPKFSDPLILG